MTSHNYLQRVTTIDSVISSIHHSHCIAAAELSATLTRSIKTGRKNTTFVTKWCVQSDPSHEWTGTLATWHLPGGSVGPPAWWAATPNIDERSRQGRNGSTRIIICKVPKLDLHWHYFVIVNNFQT